MNWQPPERSQWAQSLNLVGEAIGGANALAPLVVDELIETACTHTGLNDFGPGNWREALGVLIETINDEAKLNMTGQLMTRIEILRSLQNRLRITDAINQNPEILAQPIEAPVFICGLARSGTSITHELMAQDERFHVPRCWEVFHSWPAPEPATYTSDARIASSDAEHLLFEEVVPAYKAMHENGGELPIECIYITAQAFMSIQYAGCLNIPSYNQYIAQADNTPAFEYHKRMLQVLQFKMPGKRWVLKSPNHIDNIDVLFDVYPDATIIHTHRDPFKTLPSTLSIMGTTTWMRSDTVNMIWAKFLHKAFSMSLNAIIDKRVSGQVPEQQFIDLHYQDLVKQPVAALEAVYSKIGMSFGAAEADNISSYLAEKPQQKHGVHKYSLEDFGVDEGKVRGAFDHYIEHYGIERE